jgi:hypothetical protein
MAVKTSDRCYKDVVATPELSRRSEQDPYAGQSKAKAHHQAKVTVDSYSRKEMR